MDYFYFFIIIEINKMTFRRCILRWATATDAVVTAIRRSQRQCTCSAAPNGRWCGASGR